MEEKNKKSQGKKYLGIREIAKMAGVSTATVSRVMNHPEKCSAKTIEKVTKIIEDNHYKEEPIARFGYRFFFIMGRIKRACTPMKVYRLFLRTYYVKI